MRERVGTCMGCGSEVYCLGGFLNGISKEGKLFCFECSEAADLIERNEKRMQNQHIESSRKYLQTNSEN